MNITANYSLKKHKWVNSWGCPRGSVSLTFCMNFCQIWSVTTGALLDTLCGSNSPVTSVVLYHGFVVSASTDAASVHLWNLKYDTRHKPTVHIPTGCAHVAVTKDADRIFYVRHQSQTEVISWNNNTGHFWCKARAQSCTCLMFCQYTLTPSSLPSMVIMFQLLKHG